MTRIHLYSAVAVGWLPAFAAATDFAPIDTDIVYARPAAGDGAPVIVLLSTTPPEAWREVLDQANPAVLTLAPREAAAAADLVLEIDRDTNLHGFNALTDGADPAQLVSTGADKQRRDEASLLRERDHPDFPASGPPLEAAPGARTRPATRCCAGRFRSSRDCAHSPAARIASCGLHLTGNHVPLTQI